MGGNGGYIVDEQVENAFDSQAKSAEMGVIGALIGNQKTGDVLYPMLEPDMFLFPQLKAIYGACRELYRESRAADVITVSGKLGGEHRETMASCVAFAPNISPGRAVQYAAIVHENWRKRMLYSQLAELAMDAVTSGVLAKDITTRMEEIAASQNRLEQAVLDDSAKSMATCVAEFMCSLQRQPDAIKTGFRDLDYLTGGFQRKGVYVISARPGAGKTDFSLHLAVNMSKTVRVNYNTLEMPATQCVDRIISRITGINSALIRDHKLTDADYASIAKVAGVIYKIPLMIDDQDAITASEVKGKILKHHPDIIFLDNLQLMGASTSKKNQWEEISETTKMLKGIALKHNVVIVLLVQETRESGKGKPTLAGLRGSSSVEADADAVIFIRNEPVEGILQGEDYIETEMHVAKNRHGGTGVCRFHWQPQYHKYLAVQEGTR